MVWNLGDMLQGDSQMTDVDTLSGQEHKNNEACLRNHVQTYLDHCVVDLLKDGEITNLYDQLLHQFEQPFLEAVLMRYRYNQSKASRILGISRGTLYKKMRGYNLLPKR